MQATGMDEGASTIRSIIGSFKALRAFADFDLADQEDEAGGGPDHGDGKLLDDAGGLPAGLNLGYTINIHLPATPEIAVYNAIFKSLREHLAR